jgi:hypothetical protein
VAENGYEWQVAIELIEIQAIPEDEFIRNLKSSVMDRNLGLPPLSLVQ